MGFNQGLTFFTNNNGSWEMLSWVREEGIMDVYCECIIEEADDNVNWVEESMGDSAHMEGENGVDGRVDL